MRMVLFIMVMLSLVLNAEITSSVKIPASIHYQSTFGNHKNHPVQKVQIRQEYESLASMDREMIALKLKEQGMIAADIDLKEINSYLVYEGTVQNKEGKTMRLILDPTDGNILEQKEVL